MKMGRFYPRAPKRLPRLIVKMQPRRGNSPSAEQVDGVIEILCAINNALVDLKGTVDALYERTR